MVKHVASPAKDDNGSLKNDFEAEVFTTVKFGNRMFIATWITISSMDANVVGIDVPATATNREKILNMFKI